MAQTLIVALIVATAALYSVWSLMPAGLRRTAASRLARKLSELGAGAQTAQRVEARLASTGGCSDCSSCKGCAPAQPPTAGAAHVAIVALPKSRRPAG